MSFIELAKKRYSLRKYEDAPVEEEKLMEVLEAGRLAPSAVNFQPWHFIVLSRPESKKALSGVYPSEWFQKAPVIIVVCGDRSQSWKRSDGKDHMDIDVAIAVDHMTLAATDLGLGTCWICAFDAKRCKEVLELPDAIEPVVLLPLGYPADTPKEKKRKSKSAIISRGTYLGT